MRKVTFALSLEIEGVEEKTSHITTFETRDIVAHLNEFQQIITTLEKQKTASQISRSLEKVREKATALYRNDRETRIKQKYETNSK